jgi:plastocyanin
MAAGRDDAHRWYAAGACRGTPCDPDARPGHRSADDRRGQHNGAALAATQFNAASIVVTAGDTVHWSLFRGLHTVNTLSENTPGTPDWGSGTPVSTTFDHTFTTPGTYTYYCSIDAVRAEANAANIDANIDAGDIVLRPRRSRR